MKKMNKKGISLAELLAVVVIMGIIAAIAVPLVGQLIEDTKKDGLLGDARTLASAAQTYCLVNEDTSTFCDNGETANQKLDLTAADTENSSVEKAAKGFDEYVSKDFSDYHLAEIILHTDNKTYYVTLDDKTYHFPSYDPLEADAESKIEGTKATATPAG